MLLLGWRELELKVGGDVCVCVLVGVLLQRGSEEGGADLVPPPPPEALTSQDRWCWSNDSSSTLAFWPACILNSLTD